MIVVLAVVFAAVAVVLMVVVVMGWQRCIGVGDNVRVGSDLAGVGCSTVVPVILMVVVGVGFVIDGRSGRVGVSGGDCSCSAGSIGLKRLLVVVGLVFVFLWLMVLVLVVLVVMLVAVGLVLTGLVVA